ncbi:nuclear transport factor 2 family protein [uncultured Sphingomonas sp.]|uniref:nuclear transport factor 2 family protein n=1 Tax=uncultured Sphingomonas sp. TaxID=158754 RepID=UPI00262559C8|nr:nuclear transport factor 2 family protein [uncultured Sphingomonas sp.]
MIAPLLALLLQITPVAPIVKGTALPPPAEEQEVLAVADNLFRALTARDKARALSFFRPDGAAQAVVEKADGTRAYRHLTWQQFVGGIADSGPPFVERLTNPAVEIDGDIAMIWSDYVATVDGKVAHCGVDHFDLVREGGQWKIFNITWTQRTTGCPAA